VTEPGIPIDPDAARRRFEAALDVVRETMAREYRAATPEELAQLRGLLEEWQGHREEAYRSSVWHSFRYESPPGPAPIAWEELKAELLTVPDPPAPMVVTLSADDRAALLAGRDAQPEPARRKRGRREKDVSVLEAIRVARIYKDNSSGATDYNVHKAYVEELADEGISYDAATGDSPHLSRKMVGYLMAAIGRGWLPWDPFRKSFEIAPEFRTRRGRFVIPRRKPARRAKI
jgi:hypothetical protein